MEDLLHKLYIGQKLYSPICGKCEVVTLDSTEVYCITVKTPYLSEFDFDMYGRFAVGGETLLFELPE